MYKGNQLLESATDSNEAVGLGNMDMFQSYVVCSDHGPSNIDGVETISTKLTFGKITAGKLSQNRFEG